MFRVDGDARLIVFYYESVCIFQKVDVKLKKNARLYYVGATKCADAWSIGYLLRINIAGADIFFVSV